MRLIDADKIPWTDLSDGRGLCYVTFLEKVQRLPTVKETPVRHGKWIPVDSYSACGGDEVTWNAHGNPIAFHYCSECKEQAYANEDGEDILSAYCPQCGAKMEEE